MEKRSEKEKGNMKDKGRRKLEGKGREGNIKRNRNY